MFHNYSDKTKTVFIIVCKMIYFNYLTFLTISSVPEYVTSVNNNEVYIIYIETYKLRLRKIGLLIVMDKRLRSSLSAFRRPLLITEITN